MTAKGSIEGVALTNQIATFKFPLLMKKTQVKIIVYDLFLTENMLDKVKNPRVFLEVEIEKKTLPRSASGGHLTNKNIKTIFFVNHLV